MPNPETSIEVKSNEQKRIELIKTTVAKGATQEELMLFLYTAKKTGLDPLTRQLYFIKDNRGRVIMQTSIDGFRVVAQRSGKYAGQDEPVFTLDAQGKIEKCSVTVYQFGKNGERYPTTAVAYFSEYAKPGNGFASMWDKMPHTMISKVAESLALRKAFPQDLSGLYTAEEMDQAKPPETMYGQSKDGEPDEPDEIETEQVIDADEVPDFSEPVSDAGKKIMKALKSPAKG